MKVAIAGGSGFVGKKLTALLKENGYEVLILTRGEEKIEDGVRYIKWLGDARPKEHLEGLTAVVNLAGVSLNDGRWTEERKRAIYESRIDATNEVLRICESLKDRPKVLVNASAIGIYPASESAVYTEESSAFAHDFLGKVVQHWEAHAARAQSFGVRVCCTRFGVILGRDEGALPLITLPYKLFVGGTIGSGKQWLSWVHVDDVAGAILFAIEQEQLRGPINVVSPNAKRMAQFGAIVGEALGRPHWLPVPSIALKLALGEKSQLVLEGQYVEPQKLLAHGYKFKFVSLRDAIQHLYRN